MSLGCRAKSRAAAVRLTLALIGFCPAIVIQAQTNPLDRFVGKDLWKRRLSRRDQLQLDEIAGAVSAGDIEELAPWRVWKTRSNGIVRYIILLGKPETIIPGGSSACVQLFNPSVKRIRSWCFQTGYRGTPDSASFEYSPDLASDLIVLHMVRFINGRDIAKEYFAIRNDRLQFIRMENSTGGIVQNEYIYRDYEIGVVPDANTEQQYLELLESEDKADVLSALMFLGGRHIREPQRTFKDEPTESKYAQFFRQLLDSPRIRDAITGLSNSDNEWIRQAAVLAARGPRERLLQ